MERDRDDGRVLGIDLGTTTYPAIAHLDNTERAAVAVSSVSKIVVSS